MCVCGIDKRIRSMHTHSEYVHAFKSPVNLKSAEKRTARAECGHKTALTVALTGAALQSFLTRLSLSVHVKHGAKLTTGRADRFTSSERARHEIAP